MFVFVFVLSQNKAYRHVCQCLGDDRGALEHFEKSLSMGDAEDDTGTLCAMEISYSKLKVMKRPYFVLYFCFCIIFFLS